MTELVRAPAPKLEYVHISCRHLDLEAAATGLLPPVPRRARSAS